MNRLLFTCGSFLILAFSAEAQTLMTGQVFNNKHALGKVKVSISQRDSIIAQTETNEEGCYVIAAESGTYQLEFSRSDYMTLQVERIAILPGGRGFFYFAALAKSLHLDRVNLRCGLLPLITKDGTESGKIFTADQLRYLY